MISGFEARTLNPLCRMATLPHSPKPWSELSKLSSLLIRKERCFGISFSMFGSVQGGGFQEDLVY